MFKKQNPISLFNSLAIEEKIKTDLTWVKKVVVQEHYPVNGQVTIYCLKKDNGVPNASEIALIKNKVVEIKPASLDPANIFVIAPTPVIVNVTVNSVTPYITSLYDAIGDTITAFFIDRLDTNDSLEINDLIEVINSTYDDVSGQSVSDFILVAPTANVNVNIGEIIVLGTILQLIIMLKNLERLHIMMVLGESLYYMN